ncbi:MAG: leucine-rich repeat domain-containing protein [Christensenellales bacterium]
MCFETKKERLEKNRKTLSDCVVDIDALISVADGHRPTVERLEKIKDKLASTNPSSDKDIVNMDKKIKKTISKLSGKIKKYAINGKLNKAEKGLKKLEIMIVERGCVSRKNSINDEKDFVVKDGVLVAYKGNDSVVVIPNNVKIIGEKAFYFNESLSEVEVGASVHTIMGQAFEGCKSLSSFIGREGLVAIGDYAFCNCGALSEVVIEEGLTNIGHYAFQKCPNLYAIKLPKSLVKIGEKAFFLDKSLSGRTKRKIKKINKKALG